MVLQEALNHRDVVDANEGHEDIPKHEGGRIYKLSTLRFITKGDEVPKVLIHLLSCIFCRHASRLRENSITMAVMSDSTCAPLLKRSATGDSSVLQCAISYQWPLTLICSGWPVSPTYWRPHLLHIIKYIMLEDLQEALNFTSNTFPVVWLANSSVAISIGHVLHLGAPAQVVSRRLVWRNCQSHVNQEIPQVPRTLEGN